MAFLGRFAVAMASLMTALDVVLLAAGEPVTLLAAFPPAALVLAATVAWLQTPTLEADSAVTERVLRTARERYANAPESVVIRTRVDELEAAVAAGLAGRDPFDRPAQKKAATDGYADVLASGGKLLEGTLASRPGALGSVWDGVVFHATDTGQAWVWQSGAWHPLFGRRLDALTGQVELRGGPLDGRVVERDEFMSGVYQEMLPLSEEVGYVGVHGDYPKLLRDRVATYRLDARAPNVGVYAG